MQQVNLLEAKNRLSSLIVAAEQGEEVLIARNGVPVARIVPYVSPRVKPPGAWKGLVPYSTDWRSAETERVIERLFHGEDDAPAAGYLHPQHGLGKLPLPFSQIVAEVEAQGFGWLNITPGHGT